jgi:hypothetical protein
VDQGTIHICSGGPKFGERYRTFRSQTPKIRWSWYQSSIGICRGPALPETKCTRRYVQTFQKTPRAFPRRAPYSDGNETRFSPDKHRWELPGASFGPIDYFGRLMFVVTASSRSEAGYELFRRPLRLSRSIDPASPISHWHRQY